MQFNVKNEHLKNSGIVCVKVMIIRNSKITRQHTGMLHYRIEVYKYASAMHGQLNCEKP
jgi:hypothetical protein